MQDHHDQREELHTLSVSNESLYTFGSDSNWATEPLVPQRYELDVDKIQTVEDVKRIFRALDICFYGKQRIVGIEDLVKEAA